MANHPQAKKRNRQTIKITARNKHVRTTVRTHMKRVRLAIESGDKAPATEALKLATKQLDRAVTKGVLKRKTASRTAFGRSPRHNGIPRSSLREPLMLYGSRPAFQSPSKLRSKALAAFLSLSLLAIAGLTA